LRYRSDPSSKSDFPTQQKNETKRPVESPPTLKREAKFVEKGGDYLKTILKTIRFFLGVEYETEKHKRKSSQKTTEKQKKKIVSPHKISLCR